ncbi:hypothetical protein AOQ84DRAFT_304172 [Glonium stellatum]|uniref:Uncharacterized protein n=1 Tax=Glonium stellatum TaxID=574774 RepID=A0A8E2JMD0_9PEZI|nr:hypothetical protein AOQ84DRAFT_304172 [Glonium stellatum]
MGQNTKRVHRWIDNIPDIKLEGGMGSNTLYKTKDLRLDNQGVLQVNCGCTITSLKRLAPGTIADCLVPTDDSWSAQQIRDALKESMKEYRL